MRLLFICLGALFMTLNSAPGAGKKKEEEAKNAENTNARSIQTHTQFVEFDTKQFGV